MKRMVINKKWEILNPYDIIMVLIVKQTKCLIPVSKELKSLMEFSYKQTI